MWESNFSLSYKRLCVAASLPFVLLATAAPADVKLAFLREREGEKQIFLANGLGERPTAVTEGKRWHVYPALSADGRLLAWAEGADEKDLQIVVEQLAGPGGKAVREQWTAKAGRHLHPRFSGDGRFLAFVGPYGPEDTQRIAVLKVADVRATEPKRGVDGAVRAPKPTVVPSDYPSFFPALSSDGSFVVFERSKPDGKKDIVRYRFRDGKLTTLTAPEMKCMAPALSFDDRFVAYTAHVDGNWDVYVLDLASDKGAVRITAEPSRDFAPRFLPNGGLVFASDRSKHFQLYEISADEMRRGKYRARQIVSGDADDYAPSVSGEVHYGQAQLPAMLEPPRSSFGTARLGDVVYVAGGHQGREHTYPKESFLASLEALDLKTGEWSTLAPRPVAAHGYGIAAVEKEEQGRKKRYLYAFGGFVHSDAHVPKWKSVPFVDRYDVQANRWERIGELSAPRSSNVVATVGGKIYLIGGWDSTPKKPNDLEGKFSSVIEVFDPATEKLTVSDAVLPSPLRRAMTAVVVKDEVVLVGGIGQGSAHFDLLDKVTAFKPSTGKWRELPPLPFRTFAPAAGAIGDELFVFGGGLFTDGGKDFSYVSHVFQLSAGASQWQHTGRYLAEPKGFSMVVPVADDTLALLGGHNYEALAGDGPVRTVELFSRASK